MLAVLELNEGRLGVIAKVLRCLWSLGIAYTGAGIETAGKPVKKFTEPLVNFKLRR